jgi:hypothetical protein
MTTTSMNTYLMYEDEVYTGECKKALAHHAANGNEDGTRVPPTQVWSEATHKGEVLIASCHTVTKNGMGLE